MGWSGGTFTRVHNWQVDEGNAIGIEADRHDAEDDNLATGINTCIAKDGQNAATGNLNLGTNKLTNVGAGTSATDAATIGGTETLTNKTMTAPALTSPVISTSPTAAGATWPDLGTVTTADINGGTIDGVALGTTNTGNTESPNNNSTKLATTAYCDTQVATTLQWTHLATFNTSGTTIGSNTSIPSTATRIVFLFSELSIGTGQIYIHLGDSGGYSTTISGGVTGGLNKTRFTSTYEVNRTADINAEWSGTIEFTKINAATDKWTGSGNIGDGNATSDEHTQISGGMITLAGTLDRCQVTADTARDAGQVDVYTYS